MDIVDDVADLLGRLAGLGLPVVILVEDVHSADETLLELVEKLLRRKGAVFMVTTAWPDRMEANPRLADLMAENADRLHRIGHSGSAGAPFPAGVGLVELEEEARGAILAEAFPMTEADTREALVKRYANPLALELFCQIRRFREGERYCNADGALWLPPEERERLPQKIHDLYKNLWDELPTQIRFALSVARTITPSAINPVGAAGEDRWADPLLRRVIGDLGHPTATDVLAGMDHAPSAHGWVRVVDKNLRAFAEAAQSDIARIDGRDLLEDEFDNPREHILNALARSLQARNDDESEIVDEFDVIDRSHSIDAPLPDRGLQWRATADTTNRSRSILALHAEGYITDSHVVARAIAVLLVALVGSPQELPERIRLFNSFADLESTQIPHRISFLIRHHGATARGEIGETERAIVEFRDLLADRRRVMGSDHRDTLNTHNNLAFWLSRARKVTDSIDEFRAVLSDRTRVLGPHDPDTLTTRYKLAGRLGEAGRVPEAIKILERLLRECSQVPDLDSRDILSIRHERAYWMGKAGRAGEALKEFKQVLAEREQLSGPGHPHTLSTRQNLANQIGEVESPSAAIAAYREVLAGSEQALGGDHPQTLRVRHHLAYWLGRADHVEEAIREFEAVLIDRDRVLGPDDPETRTTRGELANLRGEE